METCIDYQGLILEQGVYWYDVRNRYWREQSRVKIQSALVVIQDFVQGNPEPLIGINSIRVTPSNVRVMGANSDTLKIEYNGIPYLKFHAKELIEELKEKGNTAILNIVGKPNLNEWMGRTSPQVFIEAYEFTNENF